MVFCILLISSVSASYITGDIYIKESGKTVFLVNTDVDPEIPGLTFENNRLTGETFELTSMQSGIWTFEMDFEYYETILLDIHLPSSLSSIQSLEGVDYLIGFDQKTLSLIDRDEELYFKVKYELEENPSYFFLYFIIVVLVVGLLIFFLGKFRKRKENKLKKIFPLINDKEREIIKLLMKKPMRQKEVRKKLDIPKASYSRYLVNLEKKKLLSREGEGKNKVLRLK